MVEQRRPQVEDEALADAGRPPTLRNRQESVAESGQHDETGEHPDLGAIPRRDRVRRASAAAGAAAPGRGRRRARSSGGSRRSSRGRAERTSTRASGSAYRPLPRRRSRDHARASRGVHQPSCALLWRLRPAVLRSTPAPTITRCAGSPSSSSPRSCSQRAVTTEVRRRRPRTRRRATSAGSTARPQGGTWSARLSRCRSITTCPRAARSTSVSCDFPRGTRPSASALSW